MEKQKRNSRVSLSYIQERFWDDLFLSDNKYSWDNMYAKMKVSKGADIQAVRYAINTIVSRHESLRTSFHTDDNGYRYQVINERLNIKVENVDFSSKSSTADSLFLKYEREFANRLFCLNRPPLFRASLVKSMNDEGILLLCFQHLIADGWSMNMLRKEILFYYSEYCKGLSNKSYSVGSRYRDYVQWERKLLRGKLLDESREYWRKELKGLHSQDCITVNECAAKSTDKRGAGIQIVLSDELSTALKESSKKLRASTGIICMAALFATIAQTTRSKDVIIGTPLLGRDSKEAKLIVGIMINHCPIRVKMNLEETFISLVRKVRSKVFGAIKYQHFQTNMMLKDFGIPRHDYKFPFTNVLFTQLSMDSEIDKTQILIDSPTKSDCLTDIRLDIMWYVYKYVNGYVMECKYRKALFEDDIMEQLVLNQVKALSILINFPYQPLRLLTLLD
jgi:hypothetical protein